MLFSIIVPIYGVEPYLRQCLESILAQTVSDYEAILVDDGSIDNCPAICDEFAARDRRFHVIHKANGGLVSARQVGVEVALGDYVVCVDGDDWLSPRYLENYIPAIDKYKPDVIVCDSIYSYSDKNINVHNNLRKGYYSREDIEHEIFPSLIYQNSKRSSFPTQLWAKAFKRDIYHRQQQLVDVVVSMGEDRACAIPTMYHSMSMYVQNTCDYYYRQIPTSMTKAKKPLNVDGPRLIYEHLSTTLDLDKFNFRSQLFQGTCHSLFNVCISQFYSNEWYGEIRKRLGDLLNIPVYKECIVSASYTNSISRKMMHWALRYRLYFLMFLYSKLK